ncbi:MAG: phage tail protein [bacterium]|nr:phage tail protein [bacterium]
MPNRRDFDHIGNFHFKVEIAGGLEVVFQEVSGLEVTTEVVEYQDGEDLTLRKRPGRTSYSNIILKRGYTASDALWTWMKTVIDGKIERRSGSLILFGDDAETEIARYNFFEAWPCRWKGFALDGKGIGAVIEELEIVVEGVEKAQ